MKQLSLFSAALGLAAPWQVVDVRFDPKAGRIDLEGESPSRRGHALPAPTAGPNTSQCMTPWSGSGGI